MKLNTGIIAHALPSEPQYICGNPDHGLTLTDIRVLTPDYNLFSNDILYLPFGTSFAGSATMFRRICAALAAARRPVHILSAPISQASF